MVLAGCVGCEDVTVITRIHFGKGFSCIKLDMEDMLCYMPRFKIYGDPVMDFEWPSVVLQDSPAPQSMYRFTCRGTDLGATDSVIVLGFTVDLVVRLVSLF